MCSCSCHCVSVSFTARGLFTRPSDSVLRARSPLSANSVPGFSLFLQALYVIWARDRLSELRDQESYSDLVLCKRAVRGIIVVLFYIYVFVFIWCAIFYYIAASEMSDYLTHFYINERNRWNVNRIGKGKARNVTSRKKYLSLVY